VRKQGSEVCEGGDVEGSRWTNEGFGELKGKLRQVDLDWTRYHLMCVGHGPSCSKQHEDLRIST
jgi:hypothetical protein